jgi:hypothetical protein
VLDLVVVGDVVEVVVEDAVGDLVRFGRLYDGDNEDFSFSQTITRGLQLACCQLENTTILFHAGNGMLWSYARTNSLWYTAQPHSYPAN